MANLLKSRVAQTVLSAEFTFTIGDTMVNASGVSDGFATAAAHAFDIAPLPYGAVVCGGDVVTETAFTTSANYNVKVGDATSDVRYLGSTDRLSAGRTALVPTGFVSTGEDIRLTVTPVTSTAGAGKMTVRIQYTMKNRANEVTGN